MRNIWASDPESGVDEEEEEGEGDDEVDADEEEDDDMLDMVLPIMSRQDSLFTRPDAWPCTKRLSLSQLFLSP